MTEISPSNPRPESLATSLPTGTVTFLFTDIEGSTRLAQEFPAELPALLARHHEILNEAIERNHGHVFQVVGDGFCAAFTTAADGVQAAVDAQEVLQREDWGETPILVRMGLHTGTATWRDGSYEGYMTLAQVQRVMSAAYGAQILVSSSTKVLLSQRLPAGVTLRDVGEHQLKGLVSPERLWQVIVPDLRQDFPPLRTLSTIPNNLPAQVTEFIGRESELASLKGMLSDPRSRLITIVGPGGMGKTRLALAAAGESTAAYPQGVYLVALDRIASATSIVQAVAEVLPISLSSEEDPKSRIIDYLRDKTILLVMDNFEHVLDGVTLVEDILASAPHVHILSTSRAKLNLMGEVLLNIGGLRIDEPSPTKNGALQLFAQSARRLQPAFELDDANLPAVARICQMVEGMPLAIVLAAAWIDTLSVDEIAAEIEQSIDILETDLRDVSDRQRSVRAVIESSWNQVDTSARDLLKRLAVYRGGFTRATAQEGAGASLRGLSQLVDKALLRRDPTTGRYSVHELLRAFAEEQLGHSAEEVRSAHEAQAAYFADFLKTSATELRDHRSEAALLAIDADIDNIRTAWSYWTEEQNAGRLVEFLAALWLYFEVRGSFAPAIQFFGDAAQRLSAAEPAVIGARAQLRAWQAWFTALIGRPEEGLRIAQESIDTLRQHDPRDITVDLLGSVSINAIFLNRIQIVAQVAAAMKERADETNDPWERGWAFVWLSYSLVLEGRVQEAMEAGREALAIFDDRKNPFGVSVASGLILGTVSMAMGDLRNGKAYFLRGAVAAEAINYVRMLQITYDNLGAVAVAEANLPQAHTYFVKSLRISQECGQPREMLASLRDLAAVKVAENQEESALQLLAVVLSHPASEQNSLNRPERLRDEAERLRAEIETRLEPSRYTLAWETGQGRRLSDVVAELLV